MRNSKYIFLIVLTSFLVSFSFSQNPVKKQKQLLSKADRAFEKEDYLKAYHLYKDYLKTDSSNYHVIYKVGLSLHLINKTDTLAAPFFIASKKYIPEAHFYLGRLYQLQEKTQKALEEYYAYSLLIRNQETFMISDSIVRGCIKTCETALIENRQRDFYVVKNLGNHINTIYPEYVPLIWNLNGGLVFTSRRPDSKGGLKDPYGRYYEDIYFSAKHDTNWSDAVPLSDKLNTETHDACVAFSPNGNELIIYRTDETKTAGDLYLSKYENQAWSFPVMLGPEINSEYLEASACFSAYGNEILFSSNKPGGYGGRDLYRVVKFLNGEYSLPVNLGPEINTEEDEDAPFLDFDNNTLYFSSKGHQGMGEYDVFKADFNPETNSWRHVQNMGQPVNSSNDDIYFMKEKGKPEGYFTSRRAGGFGDADIYEVDFSKSTMLIAYCKVFSGDSSKVENSEVDISLYDAKTGVLEGSYKPSRETGGTIILAAKDRPYRLIIESEGYRTIEHSLIFTNTNKEVVFYLNKQL